MITMIFIKTTGRCGLKPYRYLRCNIRNHMERNLDVHSMDLFEAQIAPLTVACQRPGPACSSAINSDWTPPGTSMRSRLKGSGLITSSWSSIALPTTYLYVPQHVWLGLNSCVRPVRSQNNMGARYPRRPSRQRTFRFLPAFHKAK